MWEKAESLVAPCQCLSPAGNRITSPGPTVTSSFSEAEALVRLAELDFATGKPDAALGHYDDALKTATPIGDTLNVLRAYAGKGDVDRSRKQWTSAVASYRSAIQQIELLRSQTKEQSLQTSFFSQFTSPYSHLVESLLAANASGASEDAFQASEQAKARTLVELMDSARVNVFKSMTDAERAREQQLDGRVTALTVQLNEARVHPSLREAALQDLNRQLTTAQSDYDAFRRQLFLAHPELQVKRAQFNAVTLAAAQRSVFAAHPGIAVLSYVVADDATVLFVLTPGGKSQSSAILHIHRLPISRKELGERVEALRRACVSGRGHTSRGYLISGPVFDYREQARALYETLLAPAEQDLRGATHVIVVPDAALHALPFQVLLDAQGKHWIEKQTISYAPSVTALVKMMETQARPSPSAPPSATHEVTVPLLAVGRPDFRGQLNDLPATEAEVKAIAALFAVAPLTGKEATKLHVRQQMTQARYLHLATHGLINEAAPMYSAIALTRADGDDGLLTARELIDLDLSSELAVLSACETALGKQTSGEGVLGLTWALFSAGVRSSVVTEWSVEDTSTSILMTGFYTRLRRQARTNKAEALRQAQLSLLHDARYSHPFYWAPFVLVGAWD